MSINIINIFSFLIAIGMFSWALIERSKRLPLWYILKGLEQSAMSNYVIFDELRNKYHSDNRDSIPINEFIAHLDGAYGYWRSHWELIRGIRYSVDTKIASNKEQSEKKAALPPFERA